MESKGRTAQKRWRSVGNFANIRMEPAVFLKNGDRLRSVGLGDRSLAGALLAYLQYVLNSLSEAVQSFVDNHH